MGLITSGITFAIIGFAVSAVPALFSRKSKLVKAKTKANGEKYIDYSSFVFWVIYGSAALFSLIGLLVYLFSNEPVAGIIFIALGLIFLLPMGIIQFVDTSINWTSDYICGARSGVSLKKHLILWDDVVLAKLHPNQTIQLKDKFGKSVHWSVYHNGWYEIIEDLRLIRPDIDTSDFE